MADEPGGGAGDRESEGAADSDPLTAEATDERATPPDGGSPDDPADPGGSVDPGDPAQSIDSTDSAGATSAADGTDHADADRTPDATDREDAESDGADPYVEPTPIGDADAPPEETRLDADAQSEADGGYADPSTAAPDDAAVPDEEVVLPDNDDELSEGGILGEGPASDEEQPLADHITEMVTRLGIVLLIAGVVSVALFPWGDDLITTIWYGVLPAGTTAQPHIFAPLELLVTQFKVASIAGLVVALPVLVYETYAFMRPGLYPHERRYYLAAIPTSLVLAVVGIAFGYFVVVPAVMTYFLFYSQGVATAALALGSTFNLILILMAYLAIVFQIPLFVMLAIMMGITSRRWLADRRLLFWGAFAGVSFIMTPDPTGVAPVVVAATMIVLFEGTLLLLRWTERSPSPA